MRRSCLAALCLTAMLGSPPAWCQGQGNAPSLSPDGKLLAVARHVDGKERTKSWALDLVDTDCMLSAKPVPSCTRTLGEDLFLIPTFSNFFIQWARDSKRLIAGHRVYKVSASDEPPKIFRGTGDIEPRIFEPEFLEIDPRSIHGPIDVEKVDSVIVNGRGQPVGQLLNRFPEPQGVTDMWGHEIDMPSTMSQLETRSLASEPGFYIWAGEASQRGLLAEFKPEGVRMIDVPVELHGPARIAWDSSTGGPAAFFDPFNIYPLPEKRAELEWLQVYVHTMRADNPSAELVSVSVSTENGIAYLRVLKGLACDETLIVGRGVARSLSNECPAWAKDRPGPILTSVSIPAEDFDLKGQLYAWPQAPNAKPRGLLIQFHGGPTRDVMSDRSDNTARTLSDQFDILMVDYRGSTGRGQAYAEALQQPLADVSAQDLQSVLTWLEGQKRYRGRAVGFWGTSWGGLAGYASFSRGVKGLDFIVIDNGFIENPPEARTSMCKMEGHWKAKLFGFVARDDGSCLVNGADILGKPINSRVPVLLLYGENEFNVTPIDLALDWVAEATDQHVCVSMVTSKAGGHSMLSWTPSVADSARQGVRSWLDDVLHHRKKACGARVALP